MSLVHFSFKERVEMATAWAFPISVFIAIFLGIIAFFFHTSTDWPLLFSVIWGISFLIFLSFPLYEPFMRTNYEEGTFKYYDLHLALVQLIFWILSLGAVLGFHYYVNQAVSTTFAIDWALITLFLLVVITFDLLGNSPTYKSSMSDERTLKITLDVDKCKGAAYCEVVCPKGCFEVDHVNHKARITDASLCVRCGACVAQCPFDALYYKTPDNKIVTPETIRKFKLNMMGKRAVEIK